MKFTTSMFVTPAALLITAVLSLGMSASTPPAEREPGISLADLMNPDDVMLRKSGTASAADQARKEAEAKAAAEKARKEAEANAAAEERARQEAEAKAAAEKARKEAEAKAAAEERARKEAEAKAAAEKARKEAEAKAAAEERARQEAEAKAAAEKARKEAEEKAAKKPKKLVPPESSQADVLAGRRERRKDKDASKKKQTGRDAVITAERTDYDRKEGVILFDRNVHVDDEQYQLHADRLFLFLDGTNDLKRLVALGNVSITNDDKNASCSRAVYVKKLSKIVMYGADSEPARLYQGGKKASTVQGERITFWLNSEQVEIEKPVVTVPGGSFKGGDGKDFLKNLKQ